MRRCRAAPHSDLAANDRLARKKEVEKRTRPARARRGGRRARKSLFLRLACVRALGDEAGGDVLVAVLLVAAGRTIGDARTSRNQILLTVCVTQGRISCISWSTNKNEPESLNA